MAIYGDEKHNENMEHVDNKPTFTVKLEFTDVDAKNPLEAVKEILEWIQEGADLMIYDVINEVTEEKFTVDLSGDDEDAVLPDND
jgi:delta-aminolevulinic acid dehydratase/porphobilinogen synthase